MSIYALGPSGIAADHETQIFEHYTGHTFFFAGAGYDLDVCFEHEIVINQLPVMRLWWSISWDWQSHHPLKLVGTHSKNAGVSSCWKLVRIYQVLGETLQKMVIWLIYGITFGWLARMKIHYRDSLWSMLWNGMSKKVDLLFVAQVVSCFMVSFLSGQNSNHLWITIIEAWVTLAPTIMEVESGCLPYGCFQK